MLILKDLTKVFRAGDVETTALNGINLTVAAGEFVALIGPSGCGKSTLLNIIGMLDNPSGGQYHFRGEDVTHLPERRLAVIRKQHIGFIFQSFNLIDELSVYHNVELPLVYQKVPPAKRRKRVQAVLEKVNITSRGDHLPQQLSGGQQQRVAIARAIVSQPKLILADEPTGNLDSANGDDVMNLLARLNAEGTTIIMVTHALPHAQFAQRTVRLLDGNVVAEDTRTELHAAAYG
jgi:putative ABC transport system ATP-binding protein